MKSEIETAQRFTNCLKAAKEKIPIERHERTNIYLGATAGMRLLEYDFFFFFNLKLKFNKIIKEIRIKLRLMKYSAIFEEFFSVQIFYLIMKVM